MMIYKLTELCLFVEKMKENEARPDFRCRKSFRDYNLVSAILEIRSRWAENKKLLQFVEFELSYNFWVTKRKRRETKLAVLVNLRLAGKKKRRENEVRRLSFTKSKLIALYIFLFALFIERYWHSSIEADTQCFTGLIVFYSQLKKLWLWFYLLKIN